MRTRPGRRSTASRLSVLGATVGSALIGAIAVHPVAASAAVTTESAYLKDINQERAAHGLRPLVERHGLNVVAASWSSHMAGGSTLAHNPRLASEVSNWQALGENVGEGPDIDSLDRAFWHSPEHRANILDPSYREVGIGAVVRDGIIWITVDFRDPMHAVTPHRTTADSTARAEHWSSARPQFHHRHRVLRVGSHGHDVTRVQNDLHVAADGVFGRVTRAAVQHFQRRHHHKVTGVVGHRTWRAITR
jgi:peptidoglycan hydrolase-like protein with peptidoglycan-binding domain